MWLRNHRAFPRTPLFRRSDNLYRHDDRLGRRSRAAAGLINLVDTIHFFTLLILHLRRAVVRLIRRLLYRKFRQGDRLRTVLVFRTGRLGDFLNAVPALNVLRRRLPDTRIVLATTTSSIPAVQAITKVYADSESLPWLGFVTPSLVDRAVPFTITGTSRGLDQMSRIIQDERPEAIFVLPYMGETLGAKLRKLVYFRMAGFKGPIFGFDGFQSRGFLRRSQYELGLFEHQVYGPLRAVAECAAIGPVEDRDIVQRITVPEAAILWAREILEKAGLADGDPLVAIAPGAIWPHKVWPIERYIEACFQLRAQYGCSFVVVGIELDSPLGARLSNELSDICLDMTGQTSVTQLAALLSFCSLFVGNDSGPAHLASAVGCPCVTLTSALDFPGVWAPWNSRERVARVRIDCEFCLAVASCPRGTNACIQSINSNEVMRMCGEALDQSEHLPLASFTAIRGNLHQ